MKKRLEILEPTISFPDPQSVKMEITVTHIKQNLCLPASVQGYKVDIEITSPRDIGLLIDTNEILGIFLDCGAKAGSCVTVYDLSEKKKGRRRLIAGSAFWEFGENDYTTNC
jgi:hypothetical protein